MQVASRECAARVDVSVFLICNTPVLGGLGSINIAGFETGPAPTAFAASAAALGLDPAALKCNEDRLVSTCRDLDPLVFCIDSDRVSC